MTCALLGCDRPVPSSRRVTCCPAHGQEHRRVTMRAAWRRYYHAPESHARLRETTRTRQRTRATASR